MENASKTVKKRQRRKAPQARGDLRRQQLINSALELLNEQPFEKISYADISERAEIPLPSCYHFYRNKLDLMTAVSESSAPIYRKAVYEAEFEPGEIDCWEDIIDITTDRSSRFLEENAWAREIWFSGQVPPSISLQTRERERGLSENLIGIFTRYFILPDIPQMEDVFYNAFGLGDRIYSISQIQNGHITPFMTEEAKKAKKGYLSYYLPRSLQKRQAE